jgi:hypothetical protein
MLYPTVLRCSTVFQPIITVYAYIVKVSHDHVLLGRICNNLMHMWHHVTNHLIISNDKDSNSENRIKLRVRDRIIPSPHLKEQGGGVSNREDRQERGALRDSHRLLPLIRGDVIKMEAHLSIH